MREQMASRRTAGSLTTTGHGASNKDGNEQPEQATEQTRGTMRRRHRNKEAAAEPTRQMKRLQSSSDGQAGEAAERAMTKHRTMEAELAVRAGRRKNYQRLLRVQADFDNFRAADAAGERRIRKVRVHESD